MESKFVSKRFLNDFKAHISNGTESIRFYNDEYFLKFIKKEYLNQDRIYTIERLDELKHDSLVTPEFLLYDRTGTLGYGMINYRDFSFIDTIISGSIFDKTDKESFERRKELMIKLSKAIDFINNNGFAYYDIYSKNILFNHNDLKLIDLDGGVFKGHKNQETDYDSAFYFSSHRIALFTLAYLYNVDYKKFQELFSKRKGFLEETKETLFDYLPYNLRDFFKYAISNTYSVFDETTKCLIDYDYQTYLDTISILKRTK